MEILANFTINNLFGNYIRQINIFSSMYLNQHLNLLPNQF